MDDINVFKEKMNSLVSDKNSSIEKETTNVVSGGGEKLTKENNLNKLNDVLFEQLDRLTNCNDENLNKEISKSFAITSLASQIVNNANTYLKAIKTSKEYKVEEPLFLLNNENKDD